MSEPLTHDEELRLTCLKLALKHRPMTIGDSAPEPDVVAEAGRYLAFIKGDADA